MRFLLPAIETGLLYFPLRQHVARPANVGLAAEEIRPRAADGIQLHGWWLRSPSAATAASTDTARPVVIWFSGNGGNVSGGLENARRLIDRLDVEIVSVDYRGYGESEGSPTEEGLYQDGRAVYDAVRDRGVPPNRIVLFGRSLGAAVAVDVALDRDRPVAALVLETPFLSVPALAKVHYPFIPAFLIQSRYDSARKLPAVTVPKLIVQAERDEIMPPEQATTLYELAAPPKQLHVLAGSRHNDTFIENRDDYFSAWRTLLEPARRP